MKYDKKKHLNLLKYSQELEKQEKILSDEDFFELCEFSVMLMSHLHWENRDHYFELIDEFLNGPIDFLKLKKKYSFFMNFFTRIYGLTMTFSRGIVRVGFRAAFNQDAIFITKQVDAAVEAANTLADCHPITDHFSDEAIDVLRESLDMHQPDQADVIIDLAERENGRH